SWRTPHCQSFYHIVLRFQRLTYKSATLLSCLLFPDPSPEFHNVSLPLYKQLYVPACCWLKCRPHRILRLCDFLFFLLFFFIFLMNILLILSFYILFFYV